MKKLLKLSRDLQKNSEICEILTAMQFSDEKGTPNVLGIQNIDNVTQGICVVNFQEE